MDNTQFIDFFYLNNLKLIKYRYNKVNNWKLMSTCYEVGIYILFFVFNLSGMVRAKYWEENGTYSVNPYGMILMYWDGVFDISPVEDDQFVNVSKYLPIYTHNILKNLFHFFNGVLSSKMSVSYALRIPSCRRVLNRRENLMAENNRQVW